jgi:hypothetical protein
MSSDSLIDATALSVKRDGSQSVDYDSSLVTTTSTFTQITTQASATMTANTHAETTATGSIQVHSATYTATSLTTNMTVIDTLTSDIPAVGMLPCILFLIRFSRISKVWRNLLRIDNE